YPFEKIYLKVKTILLWHDRTLSTTLVCFGYSMIASSHCRDNLYHQFLYKNISQTYYIYSQFSLSAHSQTMILNTLILSKL
ncbi:hypothetical protein CLU79DRAFT_857826, partial [Phycomyces nitens]